MSLPEPTKEYVEACLKELEQDEKFSSAEHAVKLVFEAWPRNTDSNQVLVKTVVLNQLYSTNIYYPYAVTNHIVSLDIDEQLATGNLSLVQQLARVQTPRGIRNYVSFASKYCSWHQMEFYQIYDTKVKDILWKYKTQFGFFSFSRYEIENDTRFHYPRFVEIVDQLVEKYHLRSFSRKEIDKFLWSEGMKYDHLRGE